MTPADTTADRAAILHSLNADWAKLTGQQRETIRVQAERIAKLEAALEPFAQWADYHRESTHDHYVPECEIDGPGHSLTITLGDFRAARNALAKSAAALSKDQPQ